MRPVTLDIRNVPAALTELERASHENDTCEMSKNFTFDASFTRTLALAVAVPSLANTNLVLASLIEIMQKGGLNRTT